jgi:hypothetical protein
MSHKCPRLIAALAAEENDAARFHQVVGLLNKWRKGFTPSLKLAENWTKQHGTSLPSVSSTRLKNARTELYPLGSERTLS